MRRFLLLSLSPLLLTQPALAEQTPVPGVSGASFVQGMLGLIFVIGLLLCAAWVMKRIGAGSGFGSTAGMKVVAGLSVGPRERILLLEVGETWVVVGVTSSQMRTLHSMPKGSLPEPSSPGSAQPFAAWLKHLSERRTNAS